MLLLTERSARILACPLDGNELRAQDDGLECKFGHRFGVENGVPVLTGEVRREPVPRNMEPCRHRSLDDEIDPFVNDWLVNTNGNLYWRARGHLRRYPIPAWPFGRSEGQVLVDIGCGWGRWSIAAARAGFCPIGIDVHIDALAAATRVSRQLGIQADYVCGDVEHLPLQRASVDMLFSYSVLQHLDREKVAGFFREAARVLKPRGLCLVQLPNASGLYNMLRQAGRDFREATPGTFEMRYWSRMQIREAVNSAGLQNLRIRADGYFSQNPQLSDLDLFSVPGKLLVITSCIGAMASRFLPILTRVADSLWVESHAR
jgi:2-polyprenyl-3-methyl-5-hydroxy-6-metoxy-1,4-benzoquinol methylase